MVKRIEAESRGGPTWYSLTVANDVNLFETWTAVLRRQGERALSRLLEATTGRKDLRRQLIVFFQVAAEEVEELGALGELPDDERQLWESVGADVSDAESVPRSRARSAAAFVDLMARSFRGDDAVAKFLGVNRSRVSQRVSDHSLYSFTGVDGDRCFPEWQFADHGTLPGLRAVFSALGPKIHPLVVDHWARTPSVDLVVGGENLTPVLWLQTGGDPERLVALLPEQT